MGPGTGPGQPEQARRAGSLPGGAGGPRWRGRRPGARHPPRSRPSLARSRCRTPERWSPRRRTSWHSFGGVCRWRAGRPALSARGGAAPSRPRKGQSRGGGIGAAEGAPAVSLPLAAEEAGWEEAAETEADVRGEGERDSAQESPSAPGARTCRHPFASPPRPFTALPFRTLRAPLGPHPHPRPSPSWRETRTGAGTPNARGGGPQGSRSARPSSVTTQDQTSENHVGKCGLFKKKKKVAARPAGGPRARAGWAGADSPSAGRARLGSGGKRWVPGAGRAAL